MHPTLAAALAPHAPPQSSVHLDADSAPGVAATHWSSTPEGIRAHLTEAMATAAARTARVHLALVTTHEGREG